MRSTVLALVVGASLLAQVPEPPTEAFFKGDPTQVMLACAEKAVSLQPRKQVVLAQAGHAHLIAGDKAKAEAYFDRSASGTAETYRWLGQARLECGQAKEGIAALRQVGGRETYSKNAQRDAAVVLMEAGFPKEAEEIMDGAFQMGPKDWQNVMAFGRACLRQKRQDLASVWFARIMANQRKAEGLWNEIALAFADQGAER